MRAEDRRRQRNPDGDPSGRPHRALYRGRGVPLWNGRADLAGHEHRPPRDRQGRARTDHREGERDLLRRRSRQVCAVPRLDPARVQALTEKKKKLKKPNAIGRIVRAIDAAGRDADLARRTASDPAFRRGVQSDRRETLSKFSTVKHALADRERIEKAKKKT